MTERIVDLAEGGAKVSLRNRQLVISRKGAAEATAPVEEVAVLVGANPHVVYTQAALSAMMDRGGAVVACDINHQPVGMMLPLVGHHLQAERFIRQAEAPKPARKRVWQQLVRAKIGAQGALLSERNGDDAGLGALAARVRSGDPSNVEAQASRRYWRALFGPEFRREREGEDANRLLNYGYAVLRAVVGRAVCASGLHPSLGLHHRNRYNAFCLADDLMEPFRPIVDRAVAQQVEMFGETVALNRETKGELIACVMDRVKIEGEWRTLFDALTRVGASLAQVFAGERRLLVLPEAWWPE